MKYALTSLLLLSLLAIAACKPKDNPPPEPEEYFNCEINGKYWTYRANFSGFNPCSGIGGGSSGTLGYVLAGKDCKGDLRTEIVFYLSSENNLPARDTFELKEQPSVEIIHPYPIDSGGHLSFYTDNQYTGKIIFTTRTLQQLKGYFSFDILDNNKNQIIRVTNGKFSIKQ